MILISFSIPSSAVAKSQAPAGDLYIVHFDDAPLAAYSGGIPGLAATSPRALGQNRLDAGAPASKAYLAYLDQRRAVQVERISRHLGRSVQPVFRYRAAAHGVALKLSRQEATRLSRSPGVLRVIPDRIEYLDTDAGPAWIGAPAIWNGTATPAQTGTLGEGIVIGVIDTGVNMNHPSFLATGGDGFTHTNPQGSGNYLGWCDPLNANYDPGNPCNDKLIGAWDFTDAYCSANPGTCSESDGPEDDSGHGSHTAGTAAGNILQFPAISGVAPHANLITYDACFTVILGQGSCPLSATSAAVDQAILDGVDVVNYSITGGSDPWGGDIDSFFLNAVAAGIFPAASAGNTGPSPGTTGHLGPWMMTVASSTHDRVAVENSLVDMSGGMSAPADLDGASRTAGYGPAPIVYAGDYSNGDSEPEQCLSPFPAGTWTDEIVVCDRGEIARVFKCAHVEAGGAAGCVLANTSDASQGPPEADPHIIPAIHVDQAAGIALRSWLATGVGHMARITEAAVVTDPAVADIMASTSARGPNPSFDGLKPDVTNPGVSVFAAYHKDFFTFTPSFNTISGTSMSSPHTAGSGALLMAIHPQWSPAEVKSALMMTSDATVLKEDGVTASDAFDRGAGRVDLNEAALAKLVMDETAENYVAADPVTGGDPSSLNIPSFQLGTCVVECSFRRTVRSTEAAEGGGTTWMVQTTAANGVTLTPSPAMFTVPGGGEQEITFTATVGATPLGSWNFGEIRLLETTPGMGSSLRLPGAIRPSFENVPELLRVESIEADGAYDLAGRKSAMDIDGLDTEIAGLFEMASNTAILDEDASNDDAFDDLSQVFVRFVNVTAGARLFRISTESTDSLDADLYVGTGPTPGSGTVVCSSTTATASELCEINNPAAGQYWIVVQNWAGSGSQPDRILVRDGVVYDSSASNLTVTTSAMVTAGDPFTLHFDWDIPDYQGGDIWLGFVELGTDSANPGNLGALRFELRNPSPVLFADDFESGDTSRWTATSP